MADTVAACRAEGFRVHLDGARLWNAAVALGVPPAELTRGVDSVMVALSKGLCCPAGSLLAGPRAFVDRARRVRKQLGGGMRQIGILAAAGLVALGEMIPRLAEDHAHARILATALARCRGVDVAPVQTNIVVARLHERSAPAVAGALAEGGVLIGAMDGATLRCVTHHDVSRADCERAAVAIEAVLGR
jgi:threonine aldolase